MRISIFFISGYAVQAEYHTENAKSIMLNSVTSYTTDQEKADIYDVLFKIYYIQGRALAALKKYNEADQMLAKTEKVIGELNKLSCVDDNQLDDYEIKLTQATARYHGKFMALKIELMQLWFFQILLLFCFPEITTKDYKNLWQLPLISNMLRLKKKYKNSFHI